MFLSSFFSCRKDPLAKQPSYQMDNMQFLIIPQLFKQAITSSCGTQGAPHPPDATKPSSLHVWVFTLFLSACPSHVVTHGVQGTPPPDCQYPVLGVMRFTISCAHKLRWDSLPHQWETIITVTKQKQDQIGGCSIIHMCSSSHVGESGSGGGRCGWS